MFEAISHAFGHDIESLIEEHKSKSEKYELWERKLSTVKEISLKLNEAYQRTKNSIAIRRYDALKTMIREAVTSWKEVEKKPLSKFKEAGDKEQQYDHYFDYYFGGPKEDEGGSKQFQELTAEIAEEQQEYADKSYGDLEDELEEMQSAISRMKEEFDKESERLSRLSYDYEASKYLNPFKRYDELRRIIKSFI